MATNSLDMPMQVDPSLLITKESLAQHGKKAEGEKPDSNNMKREELLYQRQVSKSRTRTKSAQRKKKTLKFVQDPV